MEAKIVFVHTSGVTFSPRPRTHPRNIGYGLLHVSYAKAESVAMPSALLAPLFDREHSADGWIFVLCQNMGEPVEENRNGYTDPYLLRQSLTAVSRKP